LSHELIRFGTGLFRVCSSPIQKTVVTIFLFHGYRSPDSGGGDDKCPGEKEIGSTLSERSSDNLFDFLLNFALAGSAFEGVEYAKRDEIDDSTTAIVWVILPGFIWYRLSATRKRRHNAFFIDSFTVARMRADRGEFQMRLNKAG
jgi:hypothetical protein